MFGIGWSEFLLIAAVAIVVIGPKDLPGTLYSLGKLVRKARQFTASIQQSIDDVVREGELQEITKTFNSPGGQDMQAEIERQIQLETEREMNSTGKGETRLVEKR